MANYHYVMGKDGRRHRVYHKRALRGRGAYVGGRNMSRARALYGRGGYYSSHVKPFLKKWVPKGTFRQLGKYAGMGIGALAGNASAGAGMGELAGEIASHLVGFGAYKVSSNSFMNGPSYKGKVMGEGQDPVRMHSSNSSIRIRHREYITDVISSASANTFVNELYEINPGLPTVFPWLSAIAQQYEQYKPLGIVFEFKTLSSQAIASSTNTTMGGVIMATDYNSINPAWQNKQQMDNAEYTCSAPIYKSFYHPIECSMSANPLEVLYIRSGAPPSGTDQRLYDLGQFQLATFGVQGESVVLGELWVTYEFELLKPVSTSALGQDVLTDHFQLKTISNAHPLGTASVAVPNSSLGGSIVNSGTEYEFNPVLQEGTYLVNYTVYGTTTALVAPSMTYSNCQVLTVFNNDSGTYLSNSGQTASYLLGSLVVSITGLNASITFGTGGTLPASPTSGDLIVTQYDSNIVN